jgi:hypothetical protein
MKHMRQAVSLVLILSASALFMGSRWARTYGGNDADVPSSMDKTLDGGFVIAGKTSSSSSAGYNDIEITKIDGRGIVQWHRLIGGLNDEGATGIRQTPDGGFIVVGYSGAHGPAYSDLLLFKLSSTGELIWQKTIAGNYADDGNSLALTADGGFIVSGGGAAAARGIDYWVIKFDANGNSQWQRLYGGLTADLPVQIKPTSEGGVIVLGYSYSYGSGGHPTIWIIKLSAGGDLQWQKEYLTDSLPRAIASTSDGGFVFMADVVATLDGDTDVFVMKVNSSGDRVWARFLGGPNDDSAGSLLIASDGGVVFSATTASFGRGGNDLWLVKLSSSGSILWQRTYGGTKNDSAGIRDSLLEGGSGSLLVGGTTENWGAGKTDVWILRLFSDGTLDDGNPIVGTSSATMTYFTGAADATTATVLSSAVSPGSPTFTIRAVAVASTLISEVLVSPPAGVTLQRAINRGVFLKEAFHTITWEADPKNAKFALAGYNLYRKLDGAPDASYVLLAELPPTTFSYVDKRLGAAKIYVYMLQTEDVEGDISAASSTVKNSASVR